MYKKNFIIGNLIEPTIFICNNNIVQKHDNLLHTSSAIPKISCFIVLYGV